MATFPHPVPAAECSALPVASRLLTPEGWRQVADLMPGDTVVNHTGSSTTVAAVVPVSAGPALELTLRDGSTLIAGADQAVLVELGRDRTRHALSMARIGELLDCGQPHLRVADLQPVQLTGRGPLPLNAWMLGLLVADACLRGSCVLWSNEDQLCRRVEQSLPPGAAFSRRVIHQPRSRGTRIVGRRPGAGNNPVVLALKELGLWNLLAHQKHVPELYKYALASERLEFIRGALDGDGCVDLQGQATWSSTSERLAEDMVFMIRSIGGRCSLRRRTGVSFTSPTQPERKAGRDCWRVGGIRIPGLVPFTLARKVARLHEPRITPLWQVAAVRPVGAAPMYSLATTTPAVLVGEGFIPLVASWPTADAVRRAA